MLIILYFFMYSILGWISECIYCSIPERKFINRGFLAGPYCPVYGCGAMLVIHILQPYKEHAILIFLLGILLTSLLEYVTSYLMEIAFHTKWWDYSTYPFNLHGRICLKNSLLFGLMVLIVIYGVHPFVVQSITKIPYLLQPSVCTILVLAFTYDMFHTTQAILHKNKAFQEVQKSMRLLYEDVKSMNITTLQEEFIEALQKVLDNTNVDEIIVSHIDKVKDKISSFNDLRKQTYERLGRAFPTKIEKHPRLDMDKLITIITKYRKNK